MQLSKQISSLTWPTRNSSLFSYLFSTSTVELTACWPFTSNRTQNPALALASGCGSSLTAPFSSVRTTLPACLFYSRKHLKNCSSNHSTTGHWCASSDYFSASTCWSDSPRVSTLSSWPYPGVQISTGIFAWPIVLSLLYWQHILTTNLPLANFRVWCLRNRRATSSALLSSL